ncbi:YxeA family protein [Listeria valentina]|uniref:YxeA family protein n=1 Tax=Listeria valentina TaxID=2705293 RepID=UPI0014303943|nr:YxeA family protein [Listeria valentina]
MKKLLVWILSLVVVACIVLVEARLITINQAGGLAEIMDRYNPLVKKEVVFVRINEPVSVNAFGDATYRQKAINKEGKTRVIEFRATHVLKEDHFLKLKVKGSYVKDYKEVTLNHVPEKVIELL